MSKNFQLCCVYFITLINFVLLVSTYGLANAQTNATSNTSSSISETVNAVLSGSIDGVIGDTVNMLTSDTANMSKNSIKNSFQNELPSSLVIGKNNHTIAPDKPIQGKIQANNETNSDSVDKIKQSFQKSMYNSTIVQSFNNNSFTKLVNQNTFDEFLYKMKNILDIDLFK